MANKGEKMLDLTKPMQTKDRKYARLVDSNSHKISLGNEKYPLIIEFMDEDDELTIEHFDRRGICLRGGYLVINVPELKLEVNKFYWTESKAIVKIYWVEASNYIRGIFIHSSINFYWDRAGKFISDQGENMSMNNITRELTPAELEEHGLVGK